ncbi:hypothetical protein SprV_0301214000 [Sparganum proliferum]
MTRGVKQSATVQKAQNLAVGACNNEDANFCSDIVRNSICNTAKNECFCRKGYVAVKEDNSVSCKTLLTDLKCRVDADCVHINHSSCHPGAGFCTCPGNTVFVPHMSACLDIGEICNEEDLICLSRLAECSPSSASQMLNSANAVGGSNSSVKNAVGTAESTPGSPLLGTCQCPPNYVPVYQKLLQYYECFQEACKNGFLVVCYQPHWDPPYEALVDRLETGEADVRLAFSGFADSSLPQCSLSAMNYFDDRVLNFANEAAELWRTIFLRLSNQAVPPNLTNRKPYCLQVDLVKTYACGIRIYQLGGGQREYQGLVEVHLERSLYNPGKDIQIPFKCIDPQISRHREERLMQNIHANVTMQAWTDEVDSKPTRVVAEGERITLRFQIHSPNEHSPAAASARSGMHPSGRPPRRQAKEGVGQQETVLSTGSQEEEVVSFAASGNFMGTQHSSPVSMVCTDAGVEVTKDTQHIRPHDRLQEGVQVFVELGLRLI